MHDNPFQPQKEDEEGPDSSNDRFYNNGITKRLGWLRFCGYLSIIFGVLSSIPIITLAYTWLQIKSGMLFLDSANAFERAKLSGAEEDYLNGIDKLGYGLKLFAVFWIVSLIVGVVFTVLYIFFIMAFFLSIGTV